MTGQDESGPRRFFQSCSNKHRQGSGIAQIGVCDRVFGSIEIQALHGQVSQSDESSLVLSNGILTEPHGKKSTVINHAMYTQHCSAFQCTHCVVRPADTTTDRLPACCTNGAACSEAETPLLSGEKVIPAPSVDLVPAATASVLLLPPPAPLLQACELSLTRWTQLPLRHLQSCCCHLWSQACS